MKKYLIIFKVITLFFMVGCEEEDPIVHSERDSVTIAKFLEATTNISGYEKFIDLTKESIVDKKIADKFKLEYDFTDANGYPIKTLKRKDLLSDEELESEETRQESLKEQIDKLEAEEGNIENVSLTNPTLLVILTAAGIDNNSALSDIKNYDDFRKLILTDFDEEVDLFVSIYDLLNKKDANITLLLPRSLPPTIPTSTEEERAELANNLLDLILEGEFRTEDLNGGIAPISSTNVDRVHTFKQEPFDLIHPNTEEVILTYTKITINRDFRDPSLITNVRQPNLSDENDWLEIERSRRNLVAGNGIVHDFIDEKADDNDDDYPDDFTFPDDGSTPTTDELKKLRENALKNNNTIITFPIYIP